jgi:putative membrane protein
MVSYDPKSWWGLIFQFHKSDTFRRLLPAMLSVALFNAMIAYLESRFFDNSFQGTSLVHSLLGFIISLLLVFRTNTAYERWWEGRRLWGQLVNTSRDLALKLHAYLPEAHPSRPNFAALIGQFAWTLRENLLNGPAPGAGAGISHGPNRVSAELFIELERLYRAGDLTDTHYRNLNPGLSSLADICGACERIKKTPIPYSYSLFIKKFVFVYTITMPFCFAPVFGYWSILLSTFMLYVLGSLELIAEEIENPFGDDANDLPTDDISRMIGVNVHEILIIETGAAARPLHRIFRPRAP